MFKTINLGKKLNFSKYSDRTLLTQGRVWPRTSTADIHKVAENSSGFPTTGKDISNSIHGR